MSESKMTIPCEEAESLIVLKLYGELEDGSKWRSI